jgi:hypothetical protein
MTALAQRSIARVESFSRILFVACFKGSRVMARGSSEAMKLAKSVLNSSAKH